MARIAVTGATGFIGRHVVAELRREGHEVRGLTRSHTPWFPPGVEVETVTGDVRSADAMRRLLDGCDAAVHLAGGFEPDGVAEETIIAGTRTVLAATRDAGVGRLVYMSCLGVDAASRSSFYRAKWQAEQAIRSSDVPFTILRPSLVLGNGDGVVRPLGDLIRSLPVVPVPGKGDVRQQPIDVRDLARCVRLCIEGDMALNEMVSAGGPMFITFRQLIDLISGQMGVGKPKVLIPLALLGSVSGAIPSSARHLFTSPRVAQLQQGVVASPGIVKRIFGIEPTSVVPRLREYMA